MLAILLFAALLIWALHSGVHKPEDDDDYWA